MKYLSYLFILLSFTSCNSDIKNTESQIHNNSRKAFLNKFKEISFDTLEVHSPDWANKKDDYYGIQLDSADAVLFPKEISTAHFIDPPGLFACYQFNINKNTIGLVVRTPSEYVPSSIKLFIYDSRTRTIKEGFELAESWGDAGDALVKKSWLYRTKNNDINSFIWVRESHDTSLESDLNPKIESWNYYYLIGVSPKVDTLSKDSITLIKQFKNFVQKKVIR